MWRIYSNPNPQGFGHIEDVDVAFWKCMDAILKIYM
jgi:hypothetical protein